ncbi:hypothetical protein TTHERM_001482640 (macronuclear) [Tetrahymena thermophila SB210]|uniref:Uncharacterized protein n=1 Tax=Tetrahymena thermophila (strain SB210) TaxID=312017 RepID=W7XE01_TETTS|nr:hypothetical protein TTHERM_001482640 [Tetrahymena thermophila SB210]EWS75847.1 hypothetical protein TTHERM_001482640 [Tetrahymena thermophila SB210]|eukprot:XP_012651617.1 hypothetical protein TTHERM_001482640 [Tetrahymena thermophila SB210]
MFLPISIWKFQIISDKFQFQIGSFGFRMRFNNQLKMQNSKSKIDGDVFAGFYQIQEINFIEQQFRNQNIENVDNTNSTYNIKEFQENLMMINLKQINFQSLQRTQDLVVIIKKIFADKECSQY